MGSQKKNDRTVRRYRINPLELVIFTLVSAGFGVSVYHLFRETEEMKFATLQPMSPQPNRRAPTQGPSRSIATISGAVDGVAPMPSRIEFEVNCAENPGFRFGNQNCPAETSQGRILPNSPSHNPHFIR